MGRKNNMATVRKVQQADPIPAPILASSVVETIYPGTPWVKVEMGGFLQKTYRKKGDGWVLLGVCLTEGVYLIDDALLAWSRGGISNCKSMETLTRGQCESGRSGEYLDVLGRKIQYRFIAQKDLSEEVNDWRLIQ